MKHLVKVVIPLYKQELKRWEYASLENTMKVLSAYPVVFLKPVELDVNDLLARYPQAEVLSVSSDWLGTKRGIVGYNDMMMSGAFYDLFSDTEYILICHTDAWIFRDELSRWCGEGYDLVAAPWPVRPRYTRFPLKQWLQLKSLLAGRKRITRLQMYGKVGNGGLCLRKVAACKAACERYASEIARFKEKCVTDALYNEDLFWALVPQEFRYPDVATALKFAYDLKPRLCYALNHQQLPMGCHGFNHKSRVRFWETFIPCARICAEEIFGK